MLTSTANRRAVKNPEIKPIPTETEPMDKINIEVIKCS